MRIGCRISSKLPKFRIQLETHPRRNGKINGEQLHLNFRVAEDREPLSISIIKYIYLIFFILQKIGVVVAYAHAELRSYNASS